MSTHTQQLLLILVLCSSRAQTLSVSLYFSRCSYPFATLNFGTGSLVASLCLQTRSTSLLSGAFKFLMGKTGKYLLCFHLVFALWSTQLCVYMQFVQERANFSHVDGKCTLKLTGWLSISLPRSFVLSLCLNWFVCVSRIFGEYVCVLYSGSLGRWWCKCACVRFINRMEMQLVPQEMFRTLSLIRTFGCVLQTTAIMIDQHAR